MAKSRYQINKFTVAGRREFPFDMLRYDCCYPVSSEDAAKLDFNSYHDDRDKIRQVELYCANQTGRVTEGRWESFGWHVVQTKNASGEVLSQTPLYTEPKRWGVG